MRSANICGILQSLCGYSSSGYSRLILPVSVNNIFLLCMPSPCSPAAETALQPLIWHFESLFSHVSSSPEECFFTDTGSKDSTVSSHDFNSHDFKLRVSNPTSKYKQTHSKSIICLRKCLYSCKNSKPQGLEANLKQ